MNQSQNTATPRKDHVFISYAFDEAEFANGLKADLTEAGINCWLDTERINGGDTWPEALGLAVADSFAVAIIATRKSLESGWVRKEINWAITHQIEIIPVLRENVRKQSGFFVLNDYEWISMLEGDDYTAALTKLVVSLQKIRAEVNPESDPQRERELAYLDKLEVENLRQLYTAMSSRSEQQFRHRGDRRMKVELLPVGKDGSLQPKKQDFPDAVEAMQYVKRAALLGEPGGGKTTAILKLAMEMAVTARQNPLLPIPLFVPLREWTQAEDSLSKFIASQIGELKPYLNSLLQGRAALLLDGLNELPVDQRRSKYDQVCRFIKEHPTLMAIVSCRKEDYPPELGFDQINISPLDPIRIRQFAENYLQQVGRPDLADPLFWKLAPPEAEETLTKFLAKFGDNLSDAEQVFWVKTELPDGLHWGWEWDDEEKDNSHWKRWVGERDEASGLMKLAGNPFMLNMLVGNFLASEGELPKNRGELFKNFVLNRLNRELEDERIRPEEMTPLNEALALLAFEMQSRQAQPDDQKYSGALTVLPKSEAANILGENHERWLYLASSAGLLNKDDPVRFTHQLFQEYFAARHLDARFRAGDLQASQIWPPDKWWQRTNWEVAAVLFAGLYTNDCTAAVEWIAEANPEVAAQCLDRSGVGETLNPATRQRLTKEWIDRLTDLKREKPEARAAIGRALGLTGWDNRKGVGVVDGLPDIEWIRIPEGEFQYGDKSEQAAEPQKLWLPEFHISRYPITYRQFRAFLDDTEGFNDPRWFEGVSEDDRRMEEQNSKHSNHPREIVNWYQAMAFCRWLSWRMDQVNVRQAASLSKSGLDVRHAACLSESRLAKQLADEQYPTSWQLVGLTEVRLPTEFEWEKAARGTDGRLYPYKGKYDPKKSNVSETGIGQSSAVGIFPNGASPYGVEEMSGNVWEWCLSDYRDPKLDAAEENLRTKGNRVLRGGSWFNDRSLARAVFRGYYLPADRNDNFGFRVLCCRPPSF